MQGFFDIIIYILAYFIRFQWAKEQLDNLRISKQNKWCALAFDDYNMLNGLYYCCYLKFDLFGNKFVNKIFFTHW
jgi:hypothetical protein